MRLQRFAAVPITLGLLLTFSACSGEDDEKAVEKTPASTTAADTDATADTADDDGAGPLTEAEVNALDEALQDRDIVLPALESALSSSNAKGNWQGDVLTMSLDGDVDELTDKFSKCRIVGNFLEEGDTLILAYPNGSVDCADIPELEGQLIW